mmetsp:Transcript_26515/g.46985  ORF Transcript_26515/g.46985 Transcript_26515/m.46985 type:complete len:230 (-) Transcript_26515:3684-4373(-)
MPRPARLHFLSAAAPTKPSAISLRVHTFLTLPTTAKWCTRSLRNLEGWTCSSITGMTEMAQSSVGGGLAQMWAATRFGPTIQVVLLEHLLPQNGTSRMTETLTQPSPSPQTVLLQQLPAMPRTLGQPQASARRKRSRLQLRWGHSGQRRLGPPMNRYLGEVKALAEVHLLPQLRLQLMKSQRAGTGRIESGLASAVLAVTVPKRWVPVVEVLARTVPQSPQVAQTTTTL